MTLKGEEIINEFKARGVGIAEWARAEGFNPDLVYRVLKSKTIPSRGKSHLIAVRLGLKQSCLEQSIDLSNLQNTGAKQ